MPNKDVPRMRLFQIRNKPAKYSSARTRFMNLDAFQAGAELNGSFEVEKLPIDGREDLEAKFNSGVNRTDVPRMWGHPSVDRKLGDKTMSLANEIKGWRRSKGEPL